MKIGKEFFTLVFNPNNAQWQTTQNNQTNVDG